MEQRVAIGIDVGGTGIKGAAVDPATGALLGRRHRVPTPPGGRPEAIAAEVGAMAAAIRTELGAADGGAGAEAVAGAPIGVTLPGVVREGVMLTAANVDPAWIGLDAAALFSRVTGAACTVVNDADAAGIAETAFGEVRGLPGVTVVLTFGTGIGSAIVCDGVLVPNSELGHLELDGHPSIERHASAKAIEREGISLEAWAARAARYVAHVERLLNPDRFVLGGSISKAADRYLPFPGVRAPVAPATFRNNAGIVGAARLAASRP
ncbi:polyphosphate--glucose phosphotransferase [Leucobacter massiliensis]|uniref:Polyphosphate glucokinase n=1 Tax=Leucobacter massiliensis TaxID=1686285 RepID=A0A2S9QNN8_9MICO|nr:ROK family protein [Leucobacter massiliensis]PRI11202.1 polyphosphate glucokinase [Leucobacter massiliensis]